MPFQPLTHPGLSPASRAHRRTARRALVAAAVAAAVAVLAACGGGTLKSNDASVRVLNASTEYASVDLLNGETGVATGVPSYAASGYTDVNPGSLPLALRVPGSGVIAASLTLGVSKDSHTTVVAYNSGASPALLSIAEDDSAPPTGRARLRLLNTASVEAGGLDVYLVATGTACDALPAGTPAAASNVAVGTAATADVVATGAGTAYNLCVLANGSKTDLRLAVNGMTLKDQQISTLVLARTAGGVLVDALQLDRQGSLTVRRNTGALVRVAAALPAAGTVTASANASVLASALASPAIGNYQRVTAGDLGLNINGGAIAANVAAGHNATLLVRGSTAADVSVIDDATAPSTSAAQPVKLKFVNGTANTATLTVNGALLGNPVAPGAASAAFNLPGSAANAVISVNRGGGGANVQLSGQTLAAGSVYTLFMLNDAAGAPELTLRQDR